MAEDELVNSNNYVNRSGENEIVFPGSSGKTMFTLTPFVLQYGKYELYTTVIEIVNGATAGKNYGKVMVLWYLFIIIYCSIR